MASLLLPPTATSSTLKHNNQILKLKPNNNAHATCNVFLSNSNHYRFNSAKCHALFDDVAKGLLESSTVGVDQFQRVTEGLSDMQRWVFLVFGALTWIYLTARPGVLVGAIDAYLLAPLQLGLDNLSGRRNLKRSDFVVGDKLGEGSFGVVYSGVLLPKNVDVDVLQKRGRATTTQLDAKSKDKVILKKVKVGIQGAAEFGDYEEWFNYRLSRAAPETCADFLGTFVADQTNSQFTKGGKWLVWKFEVL